MGRRGTKPKDTKLKLLAGTQPCRVNSQEPKLDPGRPDPPSHLTGAALAEWERIVPELEAKGIISPAYGPALAIYCVAHARWLEARELIERTGLFLDTTVIRTRRRADDGTETVLETPNPKGCVKSNPAASVAAACEARMVAILGSFGMTPADKSRVKAEGSAAKPVDALSQFLAKRNA